MSPLILQHPTEPGTSRSLAQADISQIEPLLVTVLQQGERINEPPPLEALRAQCQSDLERLDLGVRRLLNPHIYHVSVTPRLWQLKQELIAAFKA